MMVDFDKVDDMITIIESSNMPDNYTFNEFAKVFYLEAKAIPLSKYLRANGKAKKLPKVMNMKRAGEIIIQTERDEDTKKFLKKRGYKEIPELNYTCIMLLRKGDLLSNWTKVLSYFEGKGSIQEINTTTKKILLPQERDKLQSFISSELELSEKEFQWLLDKYIQIGNSRELKKAFNKLQNQ